MNTAKKAVVSKKEEGIRPAFTGFSNATFEFLCDLADNQSRDWFLAHKAEFERLVRDPMAGFVSELGEELARRGLPFKADPKRSLFRINRDIRFSKDKSPYKTHVSAALTRDGEKMSPGVLYIHVDPKGSFAASGFHQPEPEDLKAIRQRIATRPKEFQRVLDELSKAGLKLSPDEGALKRVPRGFEEIDDPVLVDAVRRTSFTVHLPLTQKAVKDLALPNKVADFAEAAAPLLRFGWQAISLCGA